MTNTTELRKRWEAFSPFKSNVADLMKKRKEEDARDLAHCIRENTIDFIQSEIEQAEKAKVGEVIEELKHQTSIIFPDTLGAKSTAHVLVYRLSRKFLTQPNDIH